MMADTLALAYYMKYALNNLIILLLNIRFKDIIITIDISDNVYGSSKSSIVLVVFAL